MSKTDVHLIKPCANVATVKVLEGLLELAKHGDLVGVAYVTIHQRQRWGKGVCGAAAEDCVLSIGGLMALVSDLSAYMRSRISNAETPPINGVFPISDPAKNS